MKMQMKKNPIDDVLIAVALFFGLMFLLATFTGCMNSDTGCRTVIGNHYALPKLLTTDGVVEFNIYESTEGAVVTTRKDARVAITYTNIYTNSILGMWDKVGKMTLAVEVEPLAVGVPEMQTTTPGAD